MKLQLDRRKHFYPGIHPGAYPLGLIGAYVFGEVGSGASGTPQPSISFYDSVTRQAISYGFNGAALNLKSAINGGGGLVDYNNSATGYGINGVTRAYDPHTWVMLGGIQAGVGAGWVTKNDSNSVDAGWMHSIDSTGGVDFAIEYTSGPNLHVRAAPAGIGPWADTIHFFAFTWDGTVTAANQHVWIDGIEQAHSLNSDGIGAHGSDGANLLTVDQNRNGCAFGGGNGITESFFLFNRKLAPAEIQELFVYPYRTYTSALDTMITSALSPTVPPTDFIFDDSFPYANVVTHLVQRAAADRSRVIDAAWQAVVPTGPAPSSDYIFYDSFDYRSPKLRSLRFQRNWIADASWFAALPAPNVPHSDFMFYDSQDYRALKMRVKQAAFERNQTLNVFQANFAPSFDWHFNDRYPYDRASRVKLNFPRNYDADAGIIFAATGPAAAPSIGYQFEDAFDYRWPKLRALRFPRDYIADASFAFQIPVVVPSQGYIFYDPVDYRFLRMYPAIVRSRLSEVFEAPYGWFIPPPFVPPSSWYPVVSPLSIPVHQRESLVVIGLPNDIRDGTKLPMWDFFSPGEENRTARMVRPQIRFRQWEQQEPPVQPTKTPISVFFFATMEPFAGALTKQYTRKLNAVMQPFQGVLSILTPQPAGIVGFATAVCTDIRNFFVQKFTSATICEDPRTLTVPVNTQVICQTFIKDPTATLDYNIDWTQPLVNAGDQINTSAWAVDAGLAVVSSTYVGNVATAFIAGGIDGTSYSVTNTITTVGGRTLAANFILSVQFR